MKKKLLFIIPTLSCGGAERAVVALLNKMDFTKYDIDLMLFRRDDMHYINSVPKEVNLLENDLLTDLCFCHVKHLLKFKYLLNYFQIVMTRIYTTIRLKWNSLTNAKKVFYDWDKINKYIPNLNKKYDVAVSFLEGLSNFYVTEKVDACIKIGWIRADYELWGYDRNHDLPYFKKLNYLFSVSDANAEKMKNIFPEIADKIYTMYNILDFDLIAKKSKMKIAESEFNENKDITILSIGNLRPVKGYDKSIEACKILKEKGYNFKWFVLGEGNDRARLEKMIDANELGKCFFLLGLKDNPYPYLAAADIYVQSSKHEGFSTTIREAKFFGLPIVITDCPGMSDQISDGINGLIAEQNSQDLANKIEKLIINQELRASFSEALKNSSDSDNGKELNKLLKIFDM